MGYLCFFDVNNLVDRANNIYVNVSKFVPIELGRTFGLYSFKTLLLVVSIWNTQPNHHYRSLNDDNFARIILYCGRSTDGRSRSIDSRPSAFRSVRERV